MAAKKPTGKHVCKCRIKVLKDGPYLVLGGVPLSEQTIQTSRGDSVRWKDGKRYPLKDTYLLCRCGRSKHKPFCDSTHLKGFDGKETASRTLYIQRADVYQGPSLRLTDYRRLCTHARFCMKGEGVWQYTMDSNKPASRKTAIQQASDCPSGRLVEWDRRTDIPVEPKFSPSISVTFGPQKGLLGPLWVKGLIPIESSTGKEYEVRNRVTLCRCGKSRNMPFCDGSHVG